LQERLLVALRAAVLQRLAQGRQGVGPAGPVVAVLQDRQRAFAQEQPLGVGGTAGHPLPERRAGAPEGHPPQGTARPAAVRVASSSSPPPAPGRRTNQSGPCLSEPNRLFSEPEA